VSRALAIVVWWIRDSDRYSDAPTFYAWASSCKDKVSLRDRLDINPCLHLVTKGRHEGCRNERLRSAQKQISETSTYDDAVSFLFLGEHNLIAPFHHTKAQIKSL
jgi:hypothetical protein